MPLDPSFWIILSLIVIVTVVALVIDRRNLPKKAEVSKKERNEPEKDTTQNESADEVPVHISTAPPNTRPSLLIPDPEDPEEVVRPVSDMLENLGDLFQDKIRTVYTVECTDNDTASMPVITYKDTEKERGRPKKDPRERIPRRKRRSR